MHFDGSRSTHGEEVGIISVSPTNDVIPIAYKLVFDCTNNMTKYEALLLGLRVVVLLKIKELNVYMVIPRLWLAKLKISTIQRIIS